MNGESPALPDPEIRRFHPAPGGAWFQAGLLMDMPDCGTWLPEGRASCPCGNVLFTVAFAPAEAGSPTKVFCGECLGPGKPMGLPSRLHYYIIGLINLATLDYAPAPGLAESLSQANVPPTDRQVAEAEARRIIGLDNHVNTFMEEYWRIAADANERHAYYVAHYRGRKPPKKTRSRDGENAKPKDWKQRRHWRPAGDALAFPADGDGQRPGY